MAFNPYIRVTKEAVADLLASKQREDRTLDYKQELPKSGDEGRNDFLADVTAMANTSGGVILYGVEEDRDSDGKQTGQPKQVCGLAGANVEQERQRLENMLKSNVEPNIAGVHIYGIDDVPGGPVLVMQTPRSWSAPHLMRHKKWVCFYRRNNTGNQPLDWHEIKGAFAAGEGQRVRVERFRNERVGKIVSDQLGFRLSDPSRLVIHVVPVGAIDGTSVVDVRSTYDDWQRLFPTKYGGASRRPVFEGLLVYANAKTGDTHGYALLFREGIIEVVLCALAHKPEKYPFCIAGKPFEDDVLEGLPRWLAELKEHGCSPPLLVMLSACGVRGAVMAGGSDPATWRTQHPVDRDILCAPPVVLDSFDVDLGRAMKPAFDVIWNAAGHTGSASYDEDGNRR